MKGFRNIHCTNECAKYSYFLFLMVWGFVYHLFYKKEEDANDGSKSRTQAVHPPSPTSELPPLRGTISIPSPTMDASAVLLLISSSSFPIYSSSFRICVLFSVPTCCNYGIVLVLVIAEEVAFMNEQGIRIIEQKGLQSTINGLAGSLLQVFRFDFQKHERHSPLHK